MGAAILTLGYGVRSLAEVLSLLAREKVNFLIDVRSNPFSRFKPGFSREPLDEALRSHEIRYVFMGDSLGGRPADPTCYEDGHVLYSLLQEKPFFLAGIERLIKAADQGHSICLMCSEGRPEDCHRSKLIGVALAGRGVYVAHLNELGELRSQAEVMALLEPEQAGLFEPRLRSRKAYRAVAAQSNAFE